MDWQVLTQQILAALDIRAEYESLGVKIPSKNKPTQKGWVSCFAYGREDAHPSAGINTGNDKQRGRYSDRAGVNRLNLSLFDFCAHFFPGRFSSWMDARKHFAQKAGIAITSPKREPKVKWPDEYLARTRYSPSAARIYCQFKEGINPESIAIVGGYFGRWPRRAPSQSSSSVICIPAYGAHGLDRNPTGALIVNSTGQKLSLYRGKDQPPSLEKVLCVAGTQQGILNEHAWRHLSDADTLWKVEGFTDLLALQSQIPPTHTDKHLVITNTGGCSEYPNKEILSAIYAKFKGRTFVIGDCDTPGQQGAQIWAESMANFGSAAKIITLPYDIAEKHGKDVRDYFNDGHTYADLLALTEAFPVLKGYKTNGVINGHHSQEKDFLEKKLQCCVLGEHADGTIECYSRFRRKLFTIGNPSRFHYPELLQSCGEPAQDCVSESMREIPAGKVSMPFVRNAFGLEAGRNQLVQRTVLGIGCWRVEGSRDIIIVDSGHAARWNGSALSEIDAPKIGNQVLDFAPSERWCDFPALSKLLASTTQTSSMQIVERVSDIFTQWNWKFPHDATTLAALLCSTWVQTLWTWRPLVSIPAASDAGKTTLLEAISSLFFNQKFCISVQKPTAAAIRQAVRNTAQVLLIDEFEHDRHRQEVLELLRTSSKGGIIIRGTAGQRGTRYGLKHIVYLAAIETGLKKEADKNRSIELDCKRPKRSDRGKLDMPPQGEMASIGLELLAIAIKNFDRAASLADVLKTHQIKSVPGRVTESYAVPAAMLAAIRGENENEARSTLEWMLDGKFRANRQELDEEELVRDIAQSHIGIGGGQYKLVSEILSDIDDRAAYWEHLERHGISLISPGRGPRNMALASHVFFLPAMVTRYLLSKSTRWTTDHDISQVMMRVPGAIKAQRTLLGKRCWGIEVPIDRVIVPIESEGSLKIGDEK